MLRYEAHSSAPPEAAWPLLAQPSLWHRWAPQLRGAWGLGEPEVVLGARGAARLLGVLPLPVQITAKEPGRSWAWRVSGVVDMDHRVEPRPAGGCAIVVTMAAPARAEAALRVTYGPLVAVIVRRLARVAEGRAAAG